MWTRKSRCVRTFEWEKSKKRREREREKMGPGRCRRAVGRGKLVQAILSGGRTGSRAPLQDGLLAIEAVVLQLVLPGQGRHARGRLLQDRSERRRARDRCRGRRGWRGRRRRRWRYHHVRLTREVAVEPPQDALRMVTSWDIKNKFQSVYRNFSSRNSVIGM